MFLIFIPCLSHQRDIKQKTNNNNKPKQKLSVLPINLWIRQISVKFWYTKTKQNKTETSF